MIKNIKLKSGRALGIANTNVDALPITVFDQPVVLNFIASLFLKVLRL